jgi:hypothetical protein
MTTLGSFETNRDYGREWLDLQGIWLRPRAYSTSFRLKNRTFSLEFRCTALPVLLSIWNELAVTAAGDQPAI